MNDWEHNLADLLVFQKNHGHCRVSKGWPQNPGLHKWLAIQRIRQENLSLDRLTRLYKLGFDFGPWETRWLAQFLTLLRFKEEHGHCGVPNEWKQNRSLGIWVSSHRSRKRKLYPWRRKRLDAIGFIWNMRDLVIERRFVELKAFKAKYGHCRVPYEWPENPNLSRWVRRQRERRKKLSAETRRRLDALGFIWNHFEQLWEEGFTELVKFRKKYGHCRVPHEWSQNPRLSHWVARQRRIKKKLSKEQRKRLKQLKFYDHAGC